MRDIEDVIADVKAEYDRQDMAAGAPRQLDGDNTRNDFIAYVTAYLGRAAARVLRNDKEGHDPYQMFVKATGLLLRAMTDGKV